MIIELFGPPGAGKTTFAQELALELQRAGRQADVRLSARPGEATARREAASSIALGLGERMSRLTRPLFELATAVSFNAQSEARDTSTDRLISMLPANHPLGALRMRQYLIRLSAAWRKARNGDGVVIFDQGYVQAVSSILLAKPHFLEDDMRIALALAPRSDLALHVVSPPEEIASRLNHRTQAMGGLGRLLESTVGDAADHVHAADRLQNELERMGRTVLTVRSAGDETFALELERVRAEIGEIEAKGTARCVSTNVREAG